MSEKQPSMLLMRLGRLSGLERDKLQAEANDLEEKITYFNSVLTDSDLLDRVLLMNWKIRKTLCR